ncbi:MULTISPECIES: dicarboxylate/amino acid:cation symporter [Achromobacter]|jgi:Na+/H+-dicarboxylate symporter|uniref:Cation:dicarboxylase symporter family transporter n=1 Tax=Achromobacter aegrifaciens TaxID=1287736 RepID=A0AAD2IXB5_ACHAE|nr:MULTISPECIES: cation:dicarboxylase symporter family transporter [Achromobacter]MBD9382363.1 cation:dicarboxylase symporter family transporter [Achromobacter sp. ACM02]MBD9420329.1 cation:dicarboxylase symporter family transporter [Achromobacter sp. ACM04]MBD9472362.1 cation:dicarboxylase symporter family transporter [Achromobacter sp. ACM01]MDQ1761928.1 cation:dicarboxylase symporter family transporter [Achromobacter aegrifaciens]MDR7947453.1 cation:dicarboxylase symporter family transporte
MSALNRLSGSTVLLAFCMATGALAGVMAQPLGHAAYLVGKLYLVVVNMAAMPLLVVAIFFGLRQVLDMPRPGRRIALTAALAVALVGACAVSGTLLGAAVMPGKHLSPQEHAQLGELVWSEGNALSENSVSLMESPDAGAAMGDGASRRESVMRGLLPDNFFRVLAQGNTLGILVATLLFGLAFASLSRERTALLDGIFESSYRALGIIIDRANLLIPVLAFGASAYLTSNAQAATLGAMGGFLLCFMLSAIVLSIAAMAVISARAGLPFLSVLAEMKGPLLVGLASGSATAPVPHAIEVMSARLGFSRGVAELALPFGAVFLRGGAALYFALVTLFVANLYGRPLGGAELVLVAAGSMAAAFVSAGHGGAANVAFAGLTLGLLELPVEAAGVLFVAIDLLCDGLRTVLSLLCVCVVVAWVSDGLSSERAAGRDGTAGRAPLQLAFSGMQLMLMGSCMVLAGLLIVLLGIGLGAR